MFKKITITTVATAISMSLLLAQADTRIAKRNNDHNGTPTFLKFKADQVYHINEVKQAFVTHLKLRPVDKLVLQKSHTDPIGFRHYKYQQYHKGIRVEYGTYTLHTKNNRISSMSGEFKQVDDAFDTHATLTEAQALTAALEHIAATRYKWQSIQNEAWLKAESGDSEATFYPKGELVIVENLKDRYEREKYRQLGLAYKFDIYAEQPLSRDYVYIDAHTGEVLHQDAIIKHAAANATCHTKYSGIKTLITDSHSGTYRLRDYTRGSGIVTLNLQGSKDYNIAVDFTDSDNIWKEWNNAAQDDAALDAHYGAQATYDYFLEKHNRNSYDNEGSILYSYIHYGTDFENAFWDGSRMTYGDGKEHFTALTSLDIAAHEIGHGVCSSTAALIYSYESGALNEGFSDIWAACVEHHTEPDKSTWLIGEDMMLQGLALRSMSNPKSINQPDTYGGTYWHTSSDDNGGVHTNSGVLNYWFYLLVNGGSGSNDNDDAYTLSGIGMDAAAQIAYRTETVYLSQNSNYSSARIFSIQAAEDLFGACSEEVIAVANAWYAVGIGGASNCETGGGNYGYCTTQGNSFHYEWIAQLKLGAFTKNSAGSTYSDYTSELINLPTGKAVNVRIIPGFFGSAHRVHYRIWIDFNADGDFEDANEEVFAANATNTVAKGNINIPASASGTTRMRVSMRHNATPPLCGNFDYGEVEDYTVQFGALPSCNDGLQNGSETGTDCGGNCPPCNPPSDYCNISTNAQYQWIDYVGIAQTGGNTSGNNSGYGDFSNISFTMSQGSTQPVFFSKGPNTEYRFYWGIYIDFNQDNDFEDSDELVVIGSSDTNDILSANADIPTHAKLGQTRMRVTMKYGGLAGHCGDFEYGEVEDYTVNIISYSNNIIQNNSGISLDNELIINDVLNIFPNPASDILYVQMPDFEAEARAVLYDLTGKVIRQFIWKNEAQTLNIQELPIGMYLLNVETESEVFSAKFIKE